MSKKLIALDIDGPVRNLFGKLLEVYNRVNGECITRESLSTYKLEKHFPLRLGIYQFLLSKHCYEIYTRASIVSGAKECVRELQDRYSVYFLSKQPTKLTMKYTREWINRNHFHAPVVFVEEGKSKEDYLYDYIIDDLPIPEVPGKKSILYKETWNALDKQALDWPAIIEMLIKEEKHE